MNIGSRIYYPIDSDSIVVGYITKITRERGHNFLEMSFDGCESKTHIREDLVFEYPENFTGTPKELVDRATALSYFRNLCARSSAD